LHRAGAERRRGAPRAPGVLGLEAAVGARSSPSSGSLPAWRAGWFPSNCLTYSRSLRRSFQPRSGAVARLVHPIGELTEKPRRRERCSPLRKPSTRPAVVTDSARRDTRAVSRSGRLAGGDARVIAATYRDGRISQRGDACPPWPRPGVRHAGRWGVTVGIKALSLRPGWHGRCSFAKVRLPPHPEASWFSPPPSLP
jgi:hypothetical protein